MMIAKQTILKAHLNRRLLSSRASGILSALDIPTNREINGVYDGQWKGSGEVIESVCPSTGETLARIRTVCPLPLFNAIAGPLIGP